MAEQAPLTSAGPLGHQPALDGLRAVAVAMVLCFHAGFGWMAGGYFGVSIFFTLSGFLITSLLINEHDRTGRVALGSFAARRVKRLLPASLVCLALVSVARLAGQFDQSVGLRTELIAAATHVFNWVKLGGDSSYTDVFAGSAVFVSPLEHYWSLAIEEQFYLVWPLAVVLLARRVRRWSRVLPMLFVVVAVLTPLAALVLSDDATYWATPMRAGELLAGAALVGVLRRGAVPAWAGIVGVPVAALLVVLAIVLPAASGPAYAGMFAPLAIVSATMLWSLQVPGPVRSLLTFRPLPGLGRISYGIYLFHWPVFVWLRQQGWSLTDPWRFAAATALTVGIAFASSVVVERPMRSASWSPRATITGAVGAMTVAAVTVAVLPFSRGFLEADADLLAAASAVSVDSLEPLKPLKPLVSPALALPPSPSPASAPQAETETARAEAPESTSPVATDDPARRDESEHRRPVAAIEMVPDQQIAPVATLPFTLDVPLGAPLSRPARLLMIGDSTAFYVGQALAEWAIDHRDYATSDLLWCQGCGFLRAGEVTSWDNESLAARNGEMLDVDLPAVVARIQPDVAVLMVTVVDIADRQWSGAEGPLAPTDGRYKARLTAAYRRLALDLLANGVGKVVFIKPPPAVGFVAADVTFMVDRWDALGAAIDDVAEALGPQVSVADLAAWADLAEVTDDTSWRPDGTHLTPASARDVVERWLGPTLVGVAS